MVILCLAALLTLFAKLEVCAQAASAEQKARKAKRDLWAYGKEKQEEVTRAQAEVEQAHELRDAVAKRAEAAEQRAAALGEAIQLSISTTVTSSNGAVIEQPPELLKGD